MPRRRRGRGDRRMRENMNLPELMPPIPPPSLPPPPRSTEVDDEEPRLEEALELFADIRAALTPLKFDKFNAVMADLKYTWQRPAECRERLFSLIGGHPSLIQKFNAFWRRVPCIHLPMPEDYELDGSEPDESDESEPDESDELEPEAEAQPETKPKPALPDESDESEPEAEAEAEEEPKPAP